jgi:hypothetical protein
MTATRRPAVRNPSGLFAYGSLAIIVAGWVAFAVALGVSRQSLDDVWTAVRDLPLLIEGVVWLLGFPFLIALAVWETSWPEVVRLVAVTIIALVYTYLFLPRVADN